MTAAKKATKRAPRKRQVPKADDVLSATEAAIAAAGQLEPTQVARAANLRLVAGTLATPGVEPKDMPKLSNEWRAAMREFVETTPRERSFRDQLREDGDI